MSESTAPTRPDFTKALEFLRSENVGKSARKYLPIFEDLVEEYAPAFDGLSAVRDAEATAEKAIETSDDELSVAYREFSPAVDEHAATVASAKAAAIAAVEAKFAEDEAAVAAEKAKLAEIRKNAVEGRKVALATEVNSAELSAAYKLAEGELADAVKAISRTEKDFAALVKIPTLAHVIRGHVGTNSGDKSWKPRFSEILVNGTPAPAAKNAKGEDTNPTLATAAKASGLSEDTIRKSFEKAVGGRKNSAAEWAGVCTDGAFTFTAGKEGDANFVTFVVRPQALSSTNSEDSDSE